MGWFDDAWNGTARVANNFGKIITEGTAKERLNTASALVGLIPFPIAADVGEMLLSGGAMVAGVCADPENWKKELAEGVGNIAVAAIPVPGLSAARTAVKAAAWTPGKKYLANQAIVIGDETAETIYALAQPTGEIVIENAANIVENVANNRQGKTTLNQADLLQDTINACKESNLIQIDTDGKVAENYNNYAIIYDEYKKAKELIEAQGFDVQMSPSNKIREVLPQFYEIHADKLKEEKQQANEVSARDLPGKYNEIQLG